MCVALLCIALLVKLLQASATGRKFYPVKVWSRWRIASFRLTMHELAYYFFLQQMRSCVFIAIAQSTRHGVRTRKLTQTHAILCDSWRVTGCVQLYTRQTARSKTRTYWRYPLASCLFILLLSAVVYIRTGGRPGVVGFCLLRATLINVVDRSI